MSEPSRIIIPSNFYLPADPLNDTELKRGLRVASSSIEGLGLFADRDFYQSEIIWEETLHNSRPESGGPLRWANHSDAPNSLLLLGQAPQFRTALLALRNISKDEEITYHYGVYGHTGHRAGCKCGQPGCPGFFVLREEWGENK